MSAAVLDRQLEPRDDGKLLLGLAIAHAVLDIESDRDTLGKCLSLLETPPQGLRDVPMGQFGGFEVRLNHQHDDRVSIFVDGPRFAPRRCQSAAIWVDKADLCAVFREIVAGLEQR